MVKFTLLNQIIFFSAAPGANPIPQKSLMHFSPFLSPLFIFCTCFGCSRGKSNSPKKCYTFLSPLFSDAAGRVIFFGIFFCHLFCSLFCTIFMLFLGQIKFQWPKKLKGRFSDPGQRGWLISLGLAAALQIALILPRIQTRVWRI